MKPGDEVLHAFYGRCTVERVVPDRSLVIVSTATGGAFVKPESLSPQLALDVEEEAA